LSDKYSQLENDKNKELVIQQFESISKSALKVGASKSQQDKILLDTYKIWLELEQFHSEFCELILNLVHNTFSDVAKGDCILPLSERRFFEKKADFKKIYELTKDSKDAKTCLLKYFFQKNIDVNVSDKIITQIVSKETDTKLQTFAKFKLRLDDSYSGTLDKKNRESFWTTFERLSSRIVECEQYKFSPKIFTENPHTAYSLLKLLPSLFRFWYCQKFALEKLAKTDNEIYNSFLAVAFAEIKHVPEDEIISVSLDTLLSFLKTGIETPIQLTTLNQQFFNSQNKESAYLSIYLKYMLQLWSEDNSRNSGMALPRLNNAYYSKKDRQQASDFYAQIQEVNPPLTVFLENRLSDCIVRLSNHIFNDISYDQSLDSIIDWSCSTLDIPLADYKETLGKVIDEFIFAYEKINSLTISELITLTGNNLTVDHYDYFKCNCLIHLLVVQSTSEYVSFLELIQQSCEQEITCLNRSVFLNYSLLEVFGQEFKETILAKYQNFKKDAFLMAKAWLLLLNKDTEFHGDIEAFVNDNVSKFFNNKLPKSKDKFCNKKLNGEIKALCKAFDVDANVLYSFPFEDVYYLSEDELVALSYFDTDSSHCFNISELLVQLTNEYLLSQWQKVVGKHDETVIYHAFMSKFLDSKSIRFTDVILNGNRNKLKDVVQGKYFDEFVKSISNQSFNQVFLDFDESFSNCLEQKLDALSNITFLGDARFQLITDRNNIPIKLGEGGFGCVYKAKDLLFDSIVAIKLIPRWHDSAELEKQMLREASIMRQCQHKNVVTVYDVYSFNSKLFVFDSNAILDSISLLNEDHNIYGIVMEYIPESKTLDKFLNENLNFSYQQKCQILSQVCDGLEKIHSLDVVHGDIKPKNIIVDNSQNVRILDFGVSTSHNNKALGSSKDIFSSENALSGKALTDKDDIFSLAMIALYTFAPLLQAYIMKFDKGNNSKLFMALYVLIYCNHLLVPVNKPFSKLLERTKEHDRAMYDFFHGLQQFFPESRGIDLVPDDDQKIYLVILQMIAPSLLLQEVLIKEEIPEYLHLESSSQNNRESTIIFSTFLINKRDTLSKIKSSINIILNGGDQAKYIKGLIIDGKLINTSNIDSIPFVDFSEYENNFEQLITATQAQIELETPSLNKTNNLPIKPSNVWCLAKLDEYTFEVITNDENSIGCKGINGLPGPLMMQKENEYYRTKMDFHYMSDFITLLEDYYFLNRDIQGRLKYHNSLITSGDGFLCTREIFSLLFKEKEEKVLPLKSNQNINLESILLVDFEGCSSLAVVFFMLKREFEKVIRKFIHSLPKKSIFLFRKFPVESNRVFEICEGATNENDFYEKIYKQLKREVNRSEAKSYFGLYWMLFSEKRTLLEQRYLSYDRKLEEYELLLLEIETNPESEYLKEIKAIIVKSMCSKEFEYWENDRVKLYEWLDDYDYGLYKKCKYSEKIDIL
jgi:serine/threonine protein kinase